MVPREGFVHVVFLLSVSAANALQGRLLEPPERDGSSWGSLSWVPHRWRMLARAPRNSFDAQRFLNFTNGTETTLLQDIRSPFYSWAQMTFPPPATQGLEDLDIETRQLHGFAALIARRHTSPMTLPAGLPEQPAYAEPKESAWSRVVDRAAAQQRSLRALKRGKKYLGFRVLVIDPFCR